MLEHLRVLDLTDERGLLCGRLLADLGADVVQVEPLDGSSARQAPPVTAGGAPSSMFWEAFAAGKRGVALDLDDPADLDRLRRLATVADIVVTSWPRARLEALGMDPATLRAERPELVYTVVSAFGWDGPKAGYADTDLIVWAAGGPLAPHRDGDLPPLRISVPQAFLHAAADAAAGTLIAVLARGTHGTGQVVDVSAQEAVGVATLARVLATAVGDDHPEWQTTPGQRPAGRTDQSGSGAATPNSLKKWHCRDGMVELHLSMGPAAGTFTNNLFAWLAEEGAVEEPVASWDWRVVPDRLVAGELTHDDLDTARAAVRAFLLSKTKAEVLDAAIRRRLLCMAIFDMADIAESPHLEERSFWSHVDIGAVDVRIPGRMAQVRGPEGPRVRGRAPLVGEHTDVVLKEWLGQR